MENVGFIGTGVMGLRMAKNVLRAEYPVTAYDTRPEPLRELKALGAQVAVSCRSVGEASDVVIVMVANAAQVEAVLFGEDGLAGGMNPGGVVVIMSTIEPTAVKHFSERIAVRGIEVIDAPVVRGVPAAEAGTLGILTGGAEGIVDRLRPLLGTMGDVFHCGDIGSGEVVKIVNNFIIINTTLLIAEGMLTGVKYGIDAEKLVDFLKAGSANSWILGYWSDMVLNRKFDPPMFDTGMALKDTGLALSTARDLDVPMPVGTLCHQILRMAGSQGREKLDYTAAAAWMEDLAGVTIAKA